MDMMEEKTKATLLLVEDEDLIADLLKKKFVMEGYTILHAQNADDVHRILDEHNNIDLILLDLLLPGVDGFSLLGELKRDSRRSSIPVLIISNLGQEKDIAKGIELGAVDYLIKANFTPKEVVQKVSEILDRPLSSPSFPSAS